MKLGLPVLRYTSALGLIGMGWIMTGVAFTVPHPPTESAPTRQAVSPLVPVSNLLPSIAQTDSPAAHPDAARFQSAAALAYVQFRNLWQPGTGLANATPDYDKLTSWDIGSVMAAIYSARVLELIDDSEYAHMMGRTLRTVESLPLYRGVAYHKLYSSRQARMISRGGGITSRGYGWSATDLGRLLVWLDIIARNDPAHADLASAAARRIAFDSVVAGGYLYGEELRPGGSRRRFQEGRIGYEQYLAAGFAAWGADVGRALDLRTNAVPVEVAGAELLADARGLDRLVSEPFVLMGLELGWDDDMRALALAVLEAQENHSAATGTITIGSEDATGVPPNYFYYYCVYCSGQAFVVEAAHPGRSVDTPRWLSTKATFGWHALAANDFTGAALDRIEGARSPHGWSSGVFTETGRATGAYDINTAAVVLEAAAYVHLGRPLAEWRATSQSDE